MDWFYRFRRATLRADWIGIWWAILGPSGALWVVLSAIFSWFSPIAQHGWAAVALAALAATLGVLLILSISFLAFAAAWRRMRPIEPKPETDSASGKSESSNPPIIFGIMKATNVSYDGQEVEVGSGKHIVRVFLWAKNMTGGYLQGCRLTIEVTLYGEDPYQRKFTGDLNPGEVERLHVLDALVDVDRPSGTMCRPEKMGEFSIRTLSAVVNAAFSARDLAQVEKTFHVRDALSSDEYLVVSSDRDKIQQEIETIYGY